MSLNTGTLSSQLQGISAGTYADAAAEWADAWAAYFTGAVTSTGVPFTLSAPAIALAQGDMIAAMVALLPIDGKDAVGEGIIAWWERLQSAPGTYFAGATAIAQPAGLGTISADMQAVFDLNILETTLAPAMDRMAAYLHGKNAGGTATIGGVARVIS